MLTELSVLENVRQEPDPVSRVWHCRAQTLHRWYRRPAAMVTSSVWMSKKNYGEVGAKMQTVVWTYYGDEIPRWQLMEPNLQLITGCTNPWEFSLL